MQNKKYMYCKSYLLLRVAEMIQENISAFKVPHLLLNLMVLGLKAENVAVSLKLRNANVQKNYCENNYF